ncbi:MAG: amino acid ABC transporter permease [Phyllobacteriaceae bacterium]|nr:amino acid ABC transporter permease [Phyllobacteriaceae bacterium]
MSDTATTQSPAPASRAFVRGEILPQLAAPNTTRGAAHWVKTNLFATPFDSALSLLAMLVIAWYVPPMLKWLFVDAVWTGEGRAACATIAQGGVQPDGWSGACWAFVNAKFEQFIFGRYPIDERWRPTLVGIMLLALLVPLLMPRVGRKGLNALLLFGIFPIVAYVLLVGGSFGLSFVETPLWGGLLVTLVLSFVGIAVSLPLGIVLALGRRSNMPVIKLLCVIFIEVVRGVPLVTVLFMASVMLPLFLPEGVTFDKLLRALIGVALFASAYMAEVIRGGLQAMPKGQYEGADALGLTYGQKMRLIILPQTLKLVIPGIVNTFIGLFKDTSLVYIIGMFDLLGVVRQNFSDASWATPVTASTGLIFAGFVFWIFCFSMSRYSIFMERRLDRSHR